MKKLGLSTEALIAGAFGVVIAGGIALAPKVFAPEAGAQPITIAPPLGAPLSFADLIDRVEPAVVSVDVVVEQKVGTSAELEQFLEPFRGMPGFEDFFEKRQEEGEGEEPETREGRSLGSGFFISQDGFIVTNNHVIEGATKINVTLTDGRELEAELVGADKATDIAVIRVKEKGSYPYVRFGDSHSMRKGDWVVALGNPFGFDSTATAGILSADGRALGGDNPYTDYLQIDASINRGNSGGPTFDLYGNVVGVNTAIFSPTGASVGIGFAIPAELANEVSSAIIKSGKVSRGWLGVTIQNFQDEFAETLGYEEVEGAMISDVTPGSPAEKAGLRRYDVILSVNGTKVTDSTSTTRLVGKLIANSTNSFEVIRGGKRQMIQVTVGERPADPNARPEPIKTSATPAGPDTSVDLVGFGARVKPVSAEERTRLGLREGEQGLLIMDVTANGRFDELGLEKGMIILDVNTKPVPTTAAFLAAIDEAKAAKRDKALLSVRIVASQQTLFLPLDLNPEAK
jgi:serine protease Do